MSTRDVLVASDARFLDFAKQLGDDAWAAPSLCGEWSNHAVLAHLVLGRSSRLGALVAEMARRRGSFDRATAELARELASVRSPADLLDDFGDYVHRPTGMGRYFPSTLFLGDHVTHELDICLALGHEPTIATAALVAVLNAQVHLPNPFVPAFRNSRGLRVVARDVGWVHGTGPEVVGAAADLVSVLASRPAALPRMQGDGVGALAERLSVSPRTAG
jgi:uncharacterized protein (TIGR03083 family)